MMRPGKKIIAGLKEAVAHARGEDTGARVTVHHRVATPMQFASGYSLDLYCDHANPKHRFSEFPHTFTGETFRECAAVARERGWKIRVRTRTATCPKCRSKETANGQ